MDSNLPVLLEYLFPNVIVECNFIELVDLLNPYRICSLEVA